MSGPWLSVVGIGEDGLDGVAPAGRALVAHAEVLMGGERHLAMVPHGTAERLVWASPFADNLERLASLRGRRVCVLASGDPMWFGAGATLARSFAADEVTVVSHPGAFSLAAARLGWPLQETICLSAHGRPVEAVALHLQPRQRLLVLSEDGSTPARLAALIAIRGFGASRMTVFERLGGPQERCRSGIAASWSESGVADLNTVAIELRTGEDTPVLARVPGLPDDAYAHDGQLTKRELRAVTLSALAPWPGALLWDVGAGCGSIAIEWSRAGGVAVAIERDSARCDMIARNAAQLGVPSLPVLAGEAPEVLAEICNSPDAIFVGGGTSRPGLLEACWSLLKPGGRLVANAVSAEGEAALLAWHARSGGELGRISISRLAPTGRFHSWHPLMPVTQYLGIKGR